MDEEAGKIVGEYIDARLDEIAKETYASLVQAGGRVTFEETADRVRTDFRRFYSLLSAVDSVFGRRVCEAYRANIIFRRLGNYCRAHYSRDLPLSSN